MTNSQWFPPKKFFLKRSIPKNSTKAKLWQVIIQWLQLIGNVLARILCENWLPVFHTQRHKQNISFLGEGNWTGSERQKEKQHFVCVCSGRGGTRFYERPHCRTSRPLGVKRAIQVGGEEPPKTPPSLSPSNPQIMTGSRWDPVPVHSQRTIFGIDVSTGNGVREAQY